MIFLLLPFLVSFVNSQVEFVVCSSPVLAEFPPLVWFSVLFLFCFVFSFSLVSRVVRYRFHSLFGCLSVLKPLISE